MRHQKFLLFRVYQFQDAQAYGELYDLYFIKIRRYVYFKMPKGEDVDSLTAEVFLRGWEYGTSSQVENASALFYKIARNLIADYYRTRGEVLPLEKAENVVSEQDVEAQVETKIESEDLISKLKLLSDEYREVLIMRYLDEMSIGEIASALEKNPNNVRVLIYRAKKALKQIV